MNVFTANSSLLQEALGAVSLVETSDDEPSLRARPRLHNGFELWPLTLGCLTEVSGKGGGAGLTLAASFLRFAQSTGRHAIWLSSEIKPFYPPDLQACGVELHRLPVLFLAEVHQAALAANRLLQSGGFDLLIWDLASWKKPPTSLPIPFLAKIVATARYRRSVVLVLTNKKREQASLGCLTGLRFQVEALDSEPTQLNVEVCKDKRGAVGEGKEWGWSCQLPEGLPPW